MKVEFPDWVAFSTHVPAARNETTPLDIEQTDVAEASTVMVALSPELAVAVAV